MNCHTKSYSLYLYLFVTQMLSSGWIVLNSLQLSKPCMLLLALYGMNLNVFWGKKYNPPNLLRAWGGGGGGFVDILIKNISFGLLPEGNTMHESDSRSQIQPLKSNIVLLSTFFSPCSFILTSKSSFEVVVTASALCAWVWHLSLTFKFNGPLWQ